VAVQALHHLLVRELANLVLGSSSGLCAHIELQSQFFHKLCRG